VLGTRLIPFIAMGGPILSGWSSATRKLAHGTALYPPTFYLVFMKLDGAIQFNLTKIDKV
jgi:hypothetical protein